MAHRPPPPGAGYQGYPAGQAPPPYPTGQIPPPGAAGHHPQGGYYPPPAYPQPGYPQPGYPPAPNYPQGAQPPPPPAGAAPGHGHGKGHHQGHGRGHHHAKGQTGPPAPPVLYFHICSKLNSLVLDIQAGNKAAGTKVVTWEKKSPPSDNQLWYEDPSVGTIRSKLHGFCLEIVGDSVVVNPYTHGNKNQLWFLKGDRIQNRKDSRVLDIAQSETKHGARICAYKYNGTKNQLWKFEFLKTGQPAPGCAPPLPKATPAIKYFHIRSEMNRRIIDTRKGSGTAGTDVIMHSQSKRDSQLWYMDDTGALCSKVNNMAVDTSSGQAKLQPRQIGNQNQMWTLSGNRIINTGKPGEVLDIKQSKDADGAVIIPYKYSGGSNQHWHVEFI